MSSAAMTTDTAADGDRAMSVPNPSGLQLTSETAIFLAKIPREIRDMIYDHVFDDEYSESRCWSRRDGRMWEFQDRFGPGATIPGPAERLPALAAACKQIRAELLETIYRSTRFIIDVDTEGRDGDFRTEATGPFIEMGKIRHLDLKLIIYGVQSRRHIARAKPFLTDAFSIQYKGPSAQLSNAALIRSDESLSPTPYFDLKEYGFHTDFQISEVLEHEWRVEFPNIHNSDFVGQLDKVFAHLGARRNLESLNVKIYLKRYSMYPSSPDFINWDESSGVSAFLRPFKHVRGLQKATIKFVYWTDPGTREGEVRQFFQEEANSVEKWMTSSHGGCQQNPDVICFCETCFPPLPCAQVEARQAQANASLEVHDSDTNVQLRVDEIEMAKEQFQAAERREEANWWRLENWWVHDCYPCYNSEESARGYGGFYIGLQNTPHKNQYKELDGEFGQIWAEDWSTEDGFGIGNGEGC